MRTQFLPDAPLNYAHVVRDRTSGASRGFGFVTFVDPAIAKAVQMADHMIDGRNVMARKATPKQDGMMGGSMGSDMGGGMDGMCGGMAPSMLQPKLPVPTLTGGGGAGGGGGGGCGAGGGGVVVLQCRRGHRGRRGRRWRRR